ncbi:hypothetical protein B0H14DRAFT_340565 [Mycena olivaceomarginata]|nr:hypothetical protein B0H14DRAFT_340565 [Mycena olivaceomarginata]
MDSTPLFCGGASSGLGALAWAWKRCSSSKRCVYGVKVFLAGPTRGSVQCAALPVPTRGGGMCRVKKLYPRLPAATLSVPNTRCMCLRSHVSTPTKKQSTSLFAEPFLPNSVCSCRNPVYALGLVNDYSSNLGPKIYPFPPTSPHSEVKPPTRTRSGYRSFYISSFP